MCGILAVVDFTGRPISRSTVTAMRDAMVHRGPDDAGVFVEGPVALAHRRLSIIDLTDAGHQPMTNEDGSLQLVFNGEIYNYVELARDLRARGHRFRSSTDTEVILHQYEEDGADCVRKLRGMFAFALWDSRRRVLFAARDRFGIKPLYYYRDAARVILASEIKAILADATVPREPDMTAIADYLFAGRALGTKTMFRDVAEVEPGHHLVVDARSGRATVTKYWQLGYDYNHARSEASTIEQLSSVLDEAVKIHCRSDAPLGCHLSGGMDSSAIVAFASRHRERLQTFSIKFSDDEHVDESRYAKAAAAHVGAEYLQASPDGNDMADLLPFLVWHTDAPIISEGGFGYFTVSAFAEQHVKVSLTGHGGDEIFAGYPAQFQATCGRTDMFRLYSDPDRVPKKPGWITRGLRKGPRGLYRAILNRTQPPRSLEDQWIALHCSAPPGNNVHLERSFLRAIGSYSPADLYVRPFADAASDQVLDKCLYHDLVVYLPALLQLEDRFSMAVSLESRVPLLDHQVVEFLATVPPAQKIAGFEPKHLLKAVASTVLPAEVWQNREKRGFPVPGSFWKTRRLVNLVNEVLLSPESLDRGIFKRDALREACRTADVTVFWDMLNVELWLKIFIDQDARWLSQATTRFAAAPQL